MEGSISLVCSARVNSTWSKVRWVHFIEIPFRVIPGIGIDFMEAPKDQPRPLLDLRPAATEVIVPKSVF